MSQMVEELLELSALEGEQRPVPDEPVPVVDLLIAVDRLRPLIEDKEINLVFDVPADIPPIRGDLSHLQHVLRNLVHNAVKFTAAGGTITIAATATGHGQVELRCTDNGVGIRSDDLARIFERFWKADSSRRRDGEGSGLGLAIARHVVAAHQGTIRVESELGHGATFIVTLPAWSGVALRRRLSSPGASARRGASRAEPGGQRPVVDDRRGERGRRVDGETHAVARVPGADVDAARPRRRPHQRQPVVAEAHGPRPAMGDRGADAQRAQLCVEAVLHSLRWWRARSRPRPPAPGRGTHRP